MKKKNIRLINGFVACIRLHILIEALERKKLIGPTVTSKEKDSLREIVRISENYFIEIFNKPRLNDVLLRRKIESKGYKLTIEIMLIIN